VGKGIEKFEGKGTEALGIAESIWQQHRSFKGSGTGAGGGWECGFLQEQEQQGSGWETDLSARDTETKQHHPGGRIKTRALVNTRIRKRKMVIVFVTIEIPEWFPNI
jgi:hypothetical protein